MFASAAPLSDSQVLVTIAIVSAAVIYPIILCVVGGLGYFKSKAAVKA